MKYLLYKIGGFPRKFALSKKQITVGRAASNDLVIDNEFISRQHFKVTVREKGLFIEDTGSENGIFVDKEPAQSALIREGDIIRAGGIEFCFREGDREDFALSGAVLSFSDVPGKNDEFRQVDSIKTTTVTGVFKTIRQELVQSLHRFERFDDFSAFITRKLGEVPGFGALFLMVPRAPGNDFDFDHGSDFHIKFQVNGDSHALERIKRLAADGEADTAGLGGDSSVIPLEIDGVEWRLVYFSHPGQKECLENAREFLQWLAQAIQIIAGVIEGKRQKKARNRDVEKSGIDIITCSDAMKDLIEQSKKIARSDIFILIHGESGTGKELFARLIHHHSLRKGGTFVALNCAAIPENLLESELFGYEKGAFTGAYTQKKGKLELASGGTLVLDEIGDMPLSLQAKLLRALQEHEFYRLGGTTPITVNLRIISLTHHNLEQLIEGGKFREDFFYRLVHRTISIPPLRERREDIPPLINYFTGKFCKQMNRTISGYSVKAVEALVNFDWKGNVRQLENEINSIVNLTDDGETIQFDILSDKIKRDFLYEPVEPVVKNNANAVEKPRSFFHRKPGKEMIVKVLEEHNWNKTRAAEALNMTYHGLHKKMKRLGVKKDR